MELAGMMIAAMLVASAASAAILTELVVRRSEK